VVFLWDGVWVVHYVISVIVDQLGGVVDTEVFEELV